MKTKNRWIRKLCLGTLFVFIITSSWAYAGIFDKDEQGPKSFSKLAEEVKHPVVNIFTTQVVSGSQFFPFGGEGSQFGDLFKHFFGDQPKQEMETQALGSGFLIDREGHILTNNHVVSKAKEIKVKFDVGKEYDAKVIGKDPKTDLALIKIEPEGDVPKPAEFGDSDTMVVGDWVMAVGNPFALGHTVTVGIISAKGRVIGAGPYDDFIQTDAAINPGNSGGPLFNMEGKVIGINTAIIAGGQGIGFAIPINMAKSLLAQLKEGKVIRGWLGVSIQDITPEIAEFFDIKEKEGVLVSSVLPDSPAEDAGFQKGDIIVRFNGKEVKTAAELSRTVASTTPNTEVDVDIIRDGKKKTIKLEIGTMPGSEEMETPKKSSELGLALSNLTSEIRSQFGIDRNESGVVVLQVAPGSPADSAGLRPGDIIKEVNHRKITNLDEYHDIMDSAKRKDKFLFSVQRGDGSFYVVIKTE